MNLRYNLTENIDRSNLPKRGYCVVTLDKNHVARVVRFQNHPTPLNMGEYIIKYTSPSGWNISIGAESFFFQEGEADKYAKGAYDALKVDNEGNSLLIGLYNDEFTLIK